MSKPPSGDRPTLDLARWRRHRELLEAALELGHDARDAFLAERCPDAAERAEVRALVAAHFADDNPVDRVADLFGSVLDQEAKAEPDRAASSGERIGPYRLLEKIGEGGMGIVFRAVRDDGTFEQEVAIKVIRGLLFDDAARQRFLTERQILARISHPNIARLLDGGVTDDGRPFFTMEWVDGMPIDRWCDRHQLGIDARLELFLAVCEAVAAVHRSFVLHRDLKPSNILVTAQGAARDRGLVKLLDFGIAKLVDPNVSHHGSTLTQLRAFTPDYASPEQVRGEPMTTAADVYSLGVLLYHLLTGLKAHRFASSTPAALEQAICEREPTRPSLAIRRLLTGAGARAARAEAIGRARATRPDRLAHRLEGDLDTIVRKALAKDPERRYPSVSELRADLVRYLSGRPVLARRDNLRYRARKFVSRHRSPVLATALVAAALLLGLATTTLQARRARVQERLAAEQRDAARAEAERSRRVAALMTDIFRLADPTAATGASVTARELLDQGARRIEAELADDPETRADLLEVVGNVYRNLALYDDAEVILERVVTLRREQALGPTDEPLIEALEGLAVLRVEQSRLEEAENLYRQALEGRDAAGSEPADRVAALSGLGDVLLLRDRASEAMVPLHEAFDIVSARPDHDPVASFAVMRQLANALHRTDRFAEAERLFRQAIDLADQHPHATGQLQVRSILQFARLTHRFERDLEGALPYYRQALERAERAYPAGHPQIATCAGELSRALRDLGRLDEAEPVAREALRMWVAAAGDPHRETGIARSALATILHRQGRLDEAEGLLRQVVTDYRTLYPERHQLLMQAAGSLASVLEDAGDLDEAADLRLEALADARALYGEDHPFVARGLSGLASVRQLAGRHDEAEQLLRDALSVRRRLHAEGHWRIAEARARLATFLAEIGRADEARPLLRDALTALEAALGPDDAVTREVRSKLDKLG